MMAHDIRTAVVAALIAAAVSLTLLARLHWRDRRWQAQTDARLADLHDSLATKRKAISQMLDSIELRDRLIRTQEEALQRQMRRINDARGQGLSDHISKVQSEVEADLDAADRAHIFFPMPPTVPGLDVSEAWVDTIPIP